MQLRVPVHYLTSMVLQAQIMKRRGTDTGTDTGIHIAFDAHNHIHLSKNGGIPPLSPQLITSSLTSAAAAAAVDEKEEEENLLRNDPEFHACVDSVIESLHLRSEKGKGVDDDGEIEDGGEDGGDADAIADADAALVLGGLALMSTQPRDFLYVRGLAKEIQMVCSNVDVVRCYGVHPWFLHQANEDFEHWNNNNNSSPTKEEEDENNDEIGTTTTTTFDSRRVNDDVDDDDDNKTASTYTCNSTIPWLSYLRHKLSSDPSSQVGEIGLDGARYDPITKNLVSSLDDQVQAFEAQMHLAADFERTVSVHAVRAWGPLMDSMRQIKSDRNKVRKERKAAMQRRPRVSNHEAAASVDTNENGGGGGKEREGKGMMPSTMMNDTDHKYATLPPRIYFHAFGGKAAIVDQLDAICRGNNVETFYGFAPVINFRSHKTASVIQKIGIDRLVLESDLEDHTGVMGDLKVNVEYIAEALGIDENEVLRRTLENARRLYQLDPYQ